MNEPASHTDGGVKRRVRVLFVPEWYPPKDGYNKEFGIFCREHVRAAALHADVAVLAFAGQRRRWPSLRFQWVDDEGVPTLYAGFGRSPIPKTTFPFFYIHLWRCVRRVIQEWGRPDVIHTQDGYAYPLMKVTQGLGIPIVVSQHSSSFLQRSLTPRMVRKFQWVFAHATRVLPANKFAQADYAAYGLSGSIRWLPNTLDTTIFYSNSQKRAKPWLLHVSTFVELKRFPDIVKAFRRVRFQRPEAVLLAAGDSVHRREMEQLAARELPVGSFRFCGYLPKPELADLMRSVRGCVFASENETFGCAIMEAMACGCPIVTTRVGGIPGVVGEGQGLFVEVGNIDQIEAGMLRLLDGTHGLDTICISKEVRERFSQNSVGLILYEEYLRAAWSRT